MSTRSPNGAWKAAFDESAGEINTKVVGAASSLVRNQQYEINAILSRVIDDTDNTLRLVTV